MERLYPHVEVLVRRYSRPGSRGAGFGHRYPRSRRQKRGKLCSVLSWLHSDFGWVQEPGKGRTKFLEVVEAETRHRMTDSLNSFVGVKEKIQRKRIQMLVEY